eukprot:44197_1
MSVFFLILEFSISFCFGVVNIRTNGSPWMCNHQPDNKQSISLLPPSDQQLINKLEQIQIFHRHGSRVGSDSISSFLPNSNLKYNCNITSVVTRQYKNNNYYTMNQSIPFIHIRKQYVPNEQIIEGNCQWRQALKYLIPQQQANAHHIKTAYIGNKSYHLFNQSILNNITLNLAKYSQDQRITVTTTDYERTIASLTVITSELFGNNNLNITDMIINTNVHDIEADPYYPDKFTACINQQQFKEWEYVYNNDPLLQNTAVDEVIKSKFANETIKAYIEEGGIWKSNKVGTHLLYPYCAGMSLPLSNSTFWNAVKLSYDWGTAATYVNTTYAKNKIECYNNFMNIPVLYKMKYDIDSLKSNGYPKLVIHSAHDSTLIRLLLSLGVYDHKLIIFGEMVTFEIYSAKSDVNMFYFRLTRKGEFVPYLYCDYENESELCDLDILLKHSFKEVVSQNNWANELCLNMLTDCRCGYCVDVGNVTQIPETTEINENPCDKKSSDVFDASSKNFWIGIGIGVGVGLLCAVFISGIIYKFRMKRTRNEHAQFL